MPTPLPRQFSTPSRSCWTSRLFAAFIVLSLAAPALAQRGATQDRIELAEKTDVRHLGYGNDGTETHLLEEGNYALTYAAAVGLTLVCVAVMFKNAKRTHLD